MDLISSKQLLKDLLAEDPDIRRKSKLTLGGLDVSDSIDVDCFVESLSSESRDLVFWSIVALARLGSRSKVATPLLVELVKTHSDFGIRQAAVSALSRISPEQFAAREAIFLALLDIHSFVRREALSAVIKIPALTGDELEKVRQLSNDPDEEVARWSEIALRNIRARAR